MDETTKNRVSIGIAVICIIVAIAITFTFFRSSDRNSAPTGPIQLLCTNPQCGYKFELSQEEFAKQMPPMPPMPGNLTMAIKCPKCGQQSAYMAVTCEKCKNVFVPNYQAAEGYPDKCPKCGFSSAEERMKNNK